MAGIYIHVPFCSSRCIYCDFYSTTLGDEWRSKYVQAVCSELIARREEFAEKAQVETIYFGGGTPSLLECSYLEQILETISKNYKCSDVIELTLECNPDDVSEEIVRCWKALGVNRISLGAQIFQDSILRFLRRRHSSFAITNAVSHLKKCGLENISLDLIYGLPGQTMKLWQQDVIRVLDENVPHVSAYALTYEAGTVLYQKSQAGEIVETDEETVRDMYMYLMNEMEGAGFRHYEISNFAIPGRESKHNSSYWKGVPYLGVGPGAHSYDGNRMRRANYPDLLSYVSSQGAPRYESEQLSDAQLLEEYVMTRMRTDEGISFAFISRLYGISVVNKLRKQALPYVEQGRLMMQQDCLKLTKDGIMVSDYIISDLISVADY